MLKSWCWKNKLCSWTPSGYLKTPFYLHVQWRSETHFLNFSFIYSKWILFLLAWTEAHWTLLVELRDKLQSTVFQNTAGTLLTVTCDVFFNWHTTAYVYFAYILGHLHVFLSCTVICSLLALGQCNSITFHMFHLIITGTWNMVEWIYIDLEPDGNRLV